MNNSIAIGVTFLGGAAFIGGICAVVAVPTALGLPVVYAVPGAVVSIIGGITFLGGGIATTRNSEQKNEEGEKLAERRIEVRVDDRSHAQSWYHKLFGKQGEKNASD